MNEKYQQLRDYIIRITAEIWEGRNLDKIHEHYAKNIVIHTPLGDLKGLDKALINTAEMLHAFPDRQLLPQEIIVSENKEKMHSSHRIVSVMHARGASLKQKASNRRVCVHTIADCAIADDKIYEEWLVRDQLAIVRQMGIEPIDYVRNKLLKVIYSNENETVIRWGLNQPAVLRYKKKDPPYAPELLLGFNPPSKRELFSSQDLSIEAEKAINAYSNFFHAVLIESRFAEIQKIYHPACSLFLPGGVCNYGREAADAFFMGYAASFSEKKFTVHHLAANEEPGLPLRVSMRWTLSGKHMGSGRFGMASGAEVVILGISHANFHKGQIISEWNLIDEIAVLVQIEAYNSSQSNN